jgi:hypothetical protein
MPRIELIFYWIIASLSVIGLLGLIITFKANVYGSFLLKYAYTFVYSYVLVLGIVLFIYRKKIAIRND